MRRRIAMVLAASATFGGAVALAPSGSAGGPSLDLDLLSPQEPLTIGLEISAGSLGCDPGSLSVDDVLVGGDPVIPLAVITDPSDPDVATIVLPSDTPPGELEVNASCTSDGEDIEVSDSLLFAALAITKVVSGPAPEGTAFGIRVECSESLDGAQAAALPDDFVVDLAYGATGGVHFVYSDHAVTCTITEPATGGAQSVAIEPETVELADPVAFSATVTNTFPVVIQPTFTG